MGWVDKNNKINGFGYLITRDGVEWKMENDVFIALISKKYIGNFQASEMSGHGKMIYRNGDVYTGNWCKNKREGIGRITNQNGRSWEGKWWNDNPVY